MEVHTEEQLLDTLQLSVSTLKGLLQLKGCYGPITNEHRDAVRIMQGAELAVFVSLITDLAEPFADDCVTEAIAAIREVVPQYLIAANVNATEYLATCEAYQGYVGNDRRV